MTLAANGLLAHLTPLTSGKYSKPGFHAKKTYLKETETIFIIRHSAWYVKEVDFSNIICIQKFNLNSNDF